MRPKPTVERVAKLANVSPATVSRVLNRSSRVGADVEKRVRAAAESRGLDLRSKRRTKLIAFLLANSFFRSITARIRFGLSSTSREYCAAAT